MVRLDIELLNQTFITNLPETKKKLYVKIIDHNDHRCFIISYMSKYFKY